jgi:hypothetical protein
MNKHVCVMILLAAVTVSHAQSGVRFADPRLKAAVEERLGKSDPNAAEMLELRSLHFNDRKDFFRLEGLQYAENLTVLQMVKNSITDIRPRGGLKKLTELALWSNRISDVSALDSLRNLKELSLHHNRISDISGLASLRSLTELRLNDNAITDVSALGMLRDLEYLDLRGNRITHISALGPLKKLHGLGLGGNQIADISVLTGLPRLSSWLDLDGNPIGDHSALCELTGVLSLSINDIGLSDPALIGPLTGLVHLDIGNNDIRDVSVLADMGKLRYLHLQGNPLYLPRGDFEGAELLRECVEGALECLGTVDLLGAGPAHKLPKNTAGFSDGYPRDGWIEQGGSVVLSGGKASLFMVICSFSEGYLDKFLTVFTPGEPGRIWLQLRWFAGYGAAGPASLWSRNAFDPRYAAEQRFLDTVKYAYGCLLDSHDRPRTHPQVYVVRQATDNGIADTQSQVQRGEGYDASNRYHRALGSAQQQKRRVEFVDVPRMRVSFTGEAKYEGLSGWVQQMGTVQLGHEGRRSLFLVAGNYGTRESEIYLGLLTPGKAGYTALCMWFDGTDTDYGPDLHRGRNAEEPLYAPEVSFLETIKYAYDYISEQDILACADDPKFAAHLWGKDNGHLREGILTLRRYPGAPQRCGSDRKVRLEVDGVTYSRCGSALMAYDRDADEHYILYHARSTYFGPAVLERVDSWLLIGLWGEGLVGVDLRDNYLRTLLAKRTSVGKIEVTDSEIVLDDGAHVLARSLLNRRAY